MSEDTSAPDQPADNGGQNDAQNQSTENQHNGAEQLGDAGKKALDAMKAERNAAVKAQRDAEAKIKQYEDSTKSESEKLLADRDTHKSRADMAEAKLLRLEVGADKGLTQRQALRLNGSTKEELEADADALLEDFKVDNKRVSSNRPQEKYRGGNSDPGEPPEETDPAKLAAAVKAAQGGFRRR